MTATLLEEPPMHSPAATGQERPGGPSARAAAIEAAGWVPPLWPLQNVIAVNPFMGLTHLPFASAIHRMGLALGRAAVWPANPPKTNGLSESLHHTNQAQQPLTFAGFCDRKLATAWETFIVDEISSFCAARFDTGLARWRVDFSSQPLYTAWKQFASLDCTGKISGFGDMRALALALPQSPLDCINDALTQLQPADEAQPLLFYASLMSVAGWAGWLRQLAWPESPDAGQHNSLIDLLAIRLAFDITLLQKPASAALLPAWRQCLALSVKHGVAATKPAANNLMTTLHAHETAFQERLLRDIKAHAASAADASAHSTRSPVQAVFCIDVRSEPYRRALEAVLPGVQTLGFAGFFGFAVNEVADTLRKQYPVLLASDLCVASTPKQSQAALAAGNGLAAAWKAFKGSTLSSYAFIEAAGAAFLPTLIAHCWPTSKAKSRSQNTPELTVENTNTGAGLTLQQQTRLAKGALTNMGLLKNQARLVLLCGHGSTSTCNPHTTALDCGACGGNTGEFNARLAAMVLNSPRVRAELLAAGITLPEDTWFVAGLHNTTTDTVELFDLQNVPESHTHDIQSLRQSLQQASDLARIYRAESIGLKPQAPKLAANITRRAKDWSQVRPEWGLVRNAGFVAARRDMTRGINLAAECFLHEYDYTLDATGSVLELIMTAPLVVASWINLQYFGSTLWPDQLSAGTKTLHNIVANIGVLEGNGGDLRPGLPLESLHNGREWVHIPRRLSAIIAAPRSMIDAVIQKHQLVKDLVDNRWLTLFATEDQGISFYRYTGECTWQPQQTPDASSP